METYHDIYDRVAKRCLTLSNRATIQLINGLYQEHYPLNSKVTYNWTEHEDDDLRRTLADTIITINDRYSYHVEFQMTADGTICVRVLEYGFFHAVKHRKGGDVLELPEPVVIYLYEGETVPDIYTLTIRFGKQKEFQYEVPVIKYQKLSNTELEQRNLITLIPFQLLKLRRAIEKERTPANLEALKNLITHDIINALNINVEAGNIMETDARKLKRLTLQLYYHIYDRYGEMEEEGVSETVEEALILDIDIIEHEHRKELEALILDIDIIEQEHRKELKEAERKRQQELEEAEHKHQQELEEAERKRQQELKNMAAERLALNLLIKGKSHQEVLAQTGLTEEHLMQLLK